MFISSYCVEEQRLQYDILLNGNPVLATKDIPPLVHVRFGSFVMKGIQWEQGVTEELGIPYDQEALDDLMRIVDSGYDMDKAQHMKEVDTEEFDVDTDNLQGKEETKLDAMGKRDFNVSDFYTEDTDEELFKGDSKPPVVDLGESVSDSINKWDDLVSKGVSDTDPE